MTCKLKILVIFLFRSLIPAIFFLYLCLGLNPTALSQTQFYAISSSFDNSAREWQIYYLDREGNEAIAAMYLKWPFRNDWTEWSVDIGPDLYTIRQTSQILPVQWTLTGPNTQVSIRQKWRGDNNMWVISNGDQSIVWNTDSPNNFELWYMETNEGSYFDMWTVYPGDARDWNIEDKAAILPLGIKIAAIFTTVYLTSPKY